MAIALRSQSANTCGATRTATPIVLAPSSVVNGDLLIAVVSANNNTNVFTKPDASWTEFAGSPFHDTASATIAVFWKVANNESGNYNFPVSGGTARSWCTWLGVYSGADTTNVPDVTPTTATSGTIPSMTTTTTGCALIAIATHSGSAGQVVTFTPPSSPGTFVEEVDQHTVIGTATENAQSVDDLIWSGSGATGTITVVGSTTPTGCFGLALRPAAPAVPASVPSSSGLVHSFPHPPLN
jgi:hypothetical protein